MLNRGKTQERVKNRTAQAEMWQRALGKSGRYFL